jgi:predicted DNA-binding protein (MmcQ/YjbR family)
MHGFMDIEDIQAYCRSLPGVTEDIKWENNLCFSVVNKLFLLISLDEVPPGASFKVAVEDFDAISSREGFRQAPYFARMMWVRVDDIGRLSRKEWEEFIQGSYYLVRSKLPAKIRKEMEG